MEGCLLFPLAFLRIFFTQLDCRSNPPRLPSFLISIQRFLLRVRHSKLKGQPEVSQEVEERLSLSVVVLQKIDLAIFRANLLLFFD